MRIESQDNVASFRSLFESGESSEAFQKKIADFFPAIIYVYDARQKKLRFINKQLTNLLGYAYSDIQNWDDLVFKDDVHLVQEELKKLITLTDDDTHCYHCRLNHKEGQWRYFWTQGTILRRNE